MADERGFRGLPAGSSILEQRQRAKHGKYVDENLEALLEKVRQAMLRYGDGGSQAEERILRMIEQEVPQVTYDQRQSLLNELLDELRGFGPITGLMQENSGVSDILVINAQRIRYQVQGRWYTLLKDSKPASFRSASHLRLIVEKLCRLGGGRVDESKPEAVLHLNGMRVTIAVEPKSPLGPFIAIRRFSYVPNLTDLVADQSLTPEAAEFMRCLSAGRRNVAFVGGMGTGKTTWIATMAMSWGQDEHPVLIEEVEECPVVHPNLRKLVSREPNIEGKGRITIGDNLRTALTSMATRIVISEIKGGEAFMVCQAMNIGHEGTLFTFHANSVQDAVSKRLPAMILMSPEISDAFHPGLLIANALHFVVLLGQDRDGHRQVIEIAEICDSDNQATVRPIFRKDREGIQAVGNVSTKQREQMARYGVELMPDILRPPKMYLT